MDAKNAALIARFRRGMVAEVEAKKIKPPPPEWDGTPLKDPSGLLVYQPEPAARLAWILRHNAGAFDGSDTGTGKTFTTLAACRELGLRPVVVCPKTVVPSWDRAARHLGVQILDAVSWELIRRPGRTSYYDAAKRWHHPVIFDEVHRGKGDGTLNSEMVLEARRSNVPAIGASATAASSPLDLRSLGYLIGLHEEHNFFAWARGYGCRKGFQGFEFRGGADDLQRLHRQIFPLRGVRVRIPDLGDLFPETQITAEAFAADNCQEIQSAYDEMEAELSELAERMQDDFSAVLVEMLRSRQRIELLKVPLLQSLIEDAIENRLSVACFVNYEATRASLVERLLAAGLRTVSIHGGQTTEERQAGIDAFQSDEVRICVANTAAGGVGVSLHDLRGEFPRLALICPDFSAVKLKQALGRVHRAGGKTKSLQKIVFVEGTVESSVCRCVGEKLRNIDLLNDGHLLPESVPEILRAC